MSAGGDSKTKEIEVFGYAKCGYQGEALNVA